jgi:hypothetical protein
MFFIGKEGGRVGIEGCVCALLGVIEIEFRELKVSFVYNFECVMIDLL